MHIDQISSDNYETVFHKLIWVTILAVAGNLWVPSDGRITHLDISIPKHKYWIDHVTFGLLYVMFRFSTRIFYMGIPGFATDCPAAFGAMY